MDNNFIIFNEVSGTKLIQEKFLHMAPEYTETLQSIWQEMGVSPSAHCDRIDSVMQYIQHLLEDMVSDEEQLLKELKSSIEEHKNELLKLSQELGEEPYNTDGELSLVELEKTLRTKMDTWNMEKQQRLKNYKQLRETEEKLCKRLALPVHDVGIMNEIPTSNQLNEIDENIKYMETQLARAMEQFQNLRPSILSLWEQLELEITTNFQKDLAKEDAENTYVLSQKNLNFLKELQAKLERKQENDFELASHLRKELKRLWTKLEIEDTEQQGFSALCTGFKPSAIQKLKEEVDKLDALKLQHIERFIAGSRRELVEMWDKCFFGDAQRHEFSPAFEDDFSEEALTIHEHQVAIMRNYYDENKDIFKMVDKRENMWKKLLEFENKENDPNRLFSNRGGALLKELKTKNAVEKGLPKVEEELKKAITLWESENEKLFLVNGEKYLDVIETQRENFKQGKKLKKLGRQKVKKETIAKEMTFGCKPSTPTKRTNTPVKTSFAVKKIRSDKVNSMASSTISSASLSPVAPVAAAHGRNPGKVKRNPRRVSCKLSKKTVRLTKTRPNTTKTLNSNSVTDTTVVIDDGSLSSCNSYSEFSNGLQEERPKEEALSSTKSQSVCIVDNVL